MSTVLSGPGSAANLANVPTRSTQDAQAFGALIQTRQADTASQANLPTHGQPAARSLLVAPSQGDVRLRDTTVRGGEGTVSMYSADPFAADPHAVPYTSVAVGQGSLAGMAAQDYTYLQAGAPVAGTTRATLTYTRSGEAERLDGTLSGTVPMGEDTTLSGSVTSTLSTSDPMLLPSRTTLSAGVSTQVGGSVTVGAEIDHTIQAGADTTRLTVEASADLGPSTALSVEHSRSLGTPPELTSPETSVTVEHGIGDVSTFATFTSTDAENRAQVGVSWPR